MSPLIDSYGRKHDYLRISVTDQCNLQCVYCMPEEGMEFAPPAHVLRAEEIYEIVKVAAKMGISKLRITGGEPTVRKDLTDIISKLSSIEGITDIALTTNGMFLSQKAAVLKKAGVTRVNISLDSLQSDRYFMITRGGKVQKVLDGLKACFAVGFDPVKINVVLMKGINEDEIEQFLQLTIDNPLHVRFIEYMPIGHEDDSWRDKFVSLEKILNRCSELGMELDQAPEEIYGNGPSQNMKLKGAVGTFGLIRPFREHFCESCNRLRLTADGNLKPCLYWEDEWPIRPFIGDEKKMIEIFQHAINGKPKNHEMIKMLQKEALSRKQTTRRMSQIGG